MLGCLGWQHGLPCPAAHLLPARGLRCESYCGLLPGRPEPLPRGLGNWVSQSLISLVTTSSCGTWQSLPSRSRIFFLIVKWGPSTHIVGKKNVQHLGKPTANIPPITTSVTTGAELRYEGDTRMLGTPFLRLRDRGRAGCWRWQGEVGRQGSSSCS